MLNQDYIEIFTRIWVISTKTCKHSSSIVSFNFNKLFHDVKPRLFSSNGLAPNLSRWRIHLNFEKIKFDVWLILNRFYLIWPLAEDRWRHVFPSSIWLFGFDPSLRNFNNCSTRVSSSFIKINRFDTCISIFSSSKKD